jgi:hypothetical protein
MSFTLKTVDAEFLFTIPNSMQVATAAAANAGIPREHIFLLEGKAESFATIQELIDIGRATVGIVSHCRIRYLRTRRTETCVAFCASVVGRLVFRKR